jgi:hypothetical protein
MGGQDRGLSRAEGCYIPNVARYRAPAAFHFGNIADQ